MAGGREVAVDLRRLRESIQPGMGPQSGRAMACTTGVCSLRRAE